MLPLLSNCSFCPVTPHHKPMHFPVLQQRTGPLLLTLLDAGSSFCPGLRLLAHPVEQGSTAPCRARSSRGLLASCHIPSQMWQQFSGRLRDSSTQLHTPINIWQKCILSLFVYSLLNTIMVSSCIAGGPIHWNFTVDFISLWVAFFFCLRYCIINVFPPILLGACEILAWLLLSHLFSIICHSLF